METECYPCIPMQSASNQKSTVMIKNEPLSEDDDDGDDEEDEEDNQFVNVVDDTQRSVGTRQRKSVTQIRASSTITGSLRNNKKASGQKHNNHTTAPNSNYNSKFNLSLSTNHTNNIEHSNNNSNNNIFFVKKQSNIPQLSTNVNSLLATVVTQTGETKITTVTTSPTGSLLSTCPNTGKVRMQQLQPQKCVRLTRVRKGYAAFLIN